MSHPMRIVPLMQLKQLERLTKIAKKTCQSMERLTKEWEARSAIRQLDGLSKAEADFHAFSDVEEMFHRTGR